MFFFVFCVLTILQNVLIKKNSIIFDSHFDICRLFSFSKYFKISLKTFKKKYCQITDGFIHLAEKDELKGKCIFLKDKMYTVYKGRPSQCRTWPFWNDNMNTKIWNKDISVNCPGVGRGKLISQKKINKLLKEDLDNEKSILQNRITPLK